MASFSKFQCDKCGKEISLKIGLLNNDLMEVTGPSDLPGGAKLPDDETFKAIAREKSTNEAYSFQNKLEEHKKECDGKMVYYGIIMAH